MNNRQKTFLEYLVKQKTLTSLKVYADIFNVSTRTISSDLKLLEPFIDNLGFEIIRHSSKGIEVKNSTKARGKEVIDKKDENNFRMNEVLERLLFNQETVTINNLAAEYYVSQTSIVNDMYQIRQFIADTDVKLISGHTGTFLSGSEFEIQQLYSKYLSKSIYSQKTKSPFEYCTEVLKHYCDPNIVDVVNKEIRTLEFSNLVTPNQYYTIDVLISLVVLVERCSKSHHLEKDEKKYLVEQIQMLPNYLIASELLSNISGQLSASFHQEDIFYFSSILIADRVEYKYSEIQINNTEIHTFITKVIQELEANLNTKINSNYIKEQLLRHVKAMVYRLKNRIKITNPLLEEIKNEYRVLFNTIWLIINANEDTLGIKITEDEVGFLLIYFQTAIEQQLHIKKVLVICPNGVATSQLIVVKLKNVLPPLDIIEVASLNKLSGAELQYFDFIVSTVNIQETSIPVVQVSALLTDLDLNNIKSIYSNIELKNENIQHERNLNSYIDLENIFIVKTQKLEKEIILNEVISQLVDKGIVHESYFESVMNREKLGTTEMQTGAAIPHGDVNLVNQFNISIIICPNGIRWDKELVKLIILICIPRSSLKMAKSIFQMIYSTVSSKRIVEGLSKLNNREEILMELGGQEFD